jgi:predicted tellurium resistance membrane protein TerC
MVAFAGPVSNFVHRHPTLKVLALAFLILIGVMLVVEGLAHQSLKVYIYFSMAFALAVELFNMRLRSSAKKTVELNEPPPVAPLPPRPPTSGTLPTQP